MDLYEKTLNESLIYQGDYLTITNVEVSLPDGNTASRDIIKHPGACAILAFFDNENVILVEQFRKAIDKTILEIPAGKLHSNEDISKCAYRELQEETGYIAGNMELLGSIATAPGFCDEVIHIFKATNLSKGEKNEDDDEFTEVKIMPISKVKELIKEGKIFDAKTLCSLAYL